EEVRSFEDRVREVGSDVLRRVELREREVASPERAPRRTEPGEVLAAKGLVLVALGLELSVPLGPHCASRRAASRAEARSSRRRRSSPPRRWGGRRRSPPA